MSTSRRTFLKAGAAATAASIARPGSSWSAVLADSAGALPLLRFAYGDVELLEGPMQRQFQANHAFYRDLDEDSLLKPFRQRAGLSAPGEDMGGWYDWVDGVHLPDNHGFAPGHSFGQYMSGLARSYAATGSNVTRDKVHRLVRGYAAAISPGFNQGNRFPAYTYDKISIGLLDAHQLTAAPDALKVLDSTLDAVLPFLPPTALSRDEQYARPHLDESFCWDEFYTLPENFFIAYQRGAGARYRDLGARFLADDWYFNPLSVGQNVLPHKHAYSHVNALSSAMQAYLILGSEKHLRAAQNGFDYLRSTQSFATGGWGPDEQFYEPGSGGLYESLTKTHSSFETPCGSYAHFKLTSYLIRVTKDSRYGDSMEKILYNTILGVKPMRKDGYGFYYSDYNNDGSKAYRMEKWTCCTGTFAQITADYGINAYFHDDQAIYVNLYIPSRLTWARGNHRISLTQETSYPHQPMTRMIISSDKPDSFPVYLRIPAWSGPKTAIAINGKHAEVSPAPGQFTLLLREWKNGDRIEVEFDMPTVLEAIDAQHPDVVAPVHGPLALFTIGSIPEGINRRELLAAAQVTSGSTDWQIKTREGNVTLRPFTSIADEHYRLYLKAGI